MATTTAADAPVETGHDLILSALLVHFDADEIDQLPHALQPVVQDVYDIAQNLVDTKIKYQSEMAVLQQELEHARAALAAERSARETANANATAAAAAASQSRATASTTAIDRDPHRMKSQAMRSIATQTRTRLPPPPPYQPVCFVKKGQPVNGHVGAASPAPRGYGSPLTGRLIPSRDVNQPLRNFVFDSKLIMNTACLGEKRQTAVMKLFRKKRGCPAAPASMGSQQVTAVPRPQNAVKSAPEKSVSTGRPQPQPISTLPDSDKADQTIRACLVLQMTSENRLLAVQMKLNQVIQWKAECVSGQVRVSIGSTSSVTKNIRSHSIEEIQAALSALQEEATELLDGCTQALGRVPESSGDKRWLRDRHTVLEETAMQLDEWIAETMTELGKFPSDSAPFKHRSPISIRVWSDVKQKRVYVNATTINADELREQHAMPTPLRVVLTEFAVCSFIAQVYGVFSTSFVRGEDFATLTQIGHLAHELEWLVERCAAAERVPSEDEEEGDEQWRVTKSSKIFKRRHATSLTAIQRRATVCSEAICGVPSRIRGQSSAFAASYATQVTNTKYSHFPVSMYTWAFYDDMVLAIVSCHVTLTRVVDVPFADRTAAIYSLLQRLDELSEAMAPWADPRFADKTSTRAFEKREYLKLMDWCERLCVHVSRVDSADA